ncbi:hypothetical protein LG298_10330 [Cytobacillus firmus]|uniref:hypothetical protein n=1 Tax=Cytobacillus firmus TaxID=1399 RepID=UPI0018CECF97|nr:hypothetical protein [Cytobacillus firmus]MBG9443936.1 hypothetical protein [Cytobacillus firmus]WHY63752.1 hypothetical protein QNH42_10420 [Cytobacillus firmus]
MKTKTEEGKENSHHRVFMMTKTEGRKEKKSPWNTQDEKIVRKENTHHKAREIKVISKLATNAQFGVINARFFHILIFLPVIKMHFILFSR